MNKRPMIGQSVDVIESGDENGFIVMAIDEAGMFRRVSIHGRDLYPSRAAATAAAVAAGLRP